MIGTPEMMKKVNTSLIFQMLIELRSATRLELANMTKISLTTVRAVLGDLLADKQILETQLDESSGGRRAHRYSVNLMKNLILSLYYENSNLVYQIVNLNNDILEIGTEDSNLTKITDLVDRCMIKWNICAIGIGVPGIVEKGKFYMGDKMDDLEANGLGELIQTKYNIPVVLENDLNAIAYGYATHYSEKHLECTKELINLAFIHINKACTGAGFVVDGKVLHGSRQFAGELGFIPLEQNKTLDQIMESCGSFERCIDPVCRTLTIINYVTNPALIVIGGDRFEAGSIKLDQIKAYVNKHYLPADICPEIILSDSFHEDYLLGLLGIKELTLHHVVPLLPLTV